jgi:probable HAF family extracellular repeat protein
VLAITCTGTTLARVAVAAPGGSLAGQQEGHDMACTRFRSTIGAATLTFILAPTLFVQSPRAATPPGPYILKDLGTLGGSSAQAYDVNDQGQVVGFATTAAPQTRAFRWQDGVMTNLGTLGGTFSSASGLNVFGQVAGSSSVAAGAPPRATFWNGSAMVNLTPDLSASEGSAAYGINDQSHIVGTISGVGAPVPFIWRGGVVTRLEDLAGPGAYAWDLNNADQVVGSAYSPDLTLLGQMQHAVLWQNDAITDLGVLPGDEDSSAVAINTFGDIVGSSGRTDPDTYESTYRPFLYSGGMMTAIQMPSTESYASDINDSRAIVGTMRAAGGFSKFHAFMYVDGVVTDLNTVIPAAGLHLVDAKAISNDGRIAGVAIDVQGRYHAFLLTPGVEENPTIYVNIGDLDMVEGNSGSRPANITVTLSPSPRQPVIIAYATGITAGSATAGVDYQSKSGTLTFAAGQTTAIISVLVNGDRKRESDEGFFVTLTGAQGAVIVKSRGVVMIRNDDR